MLLESPTSEAQASDRRAFERFPSRFPAKFKDTRDDFGIQVFLRDASTGGVRIFSKEHLYMNDSVALEIELPDGQEPMTIRGHVVWVKRREAEFWDIGLEFHKMNLLSMSRLYKFVDVPTR